MKSVNNKNNKNEKEKPVSTVRYYLQIIISLFLFYSAYNLIISPTAFYTTNDHTATFTSLTILFIIVGGYMFYDGIRGIRSKMNKKDKQKL